MDLVVPYFKKISLGASGRKSDTSSNGGLEKHRWRCMLALVIELFWISYSYFL